MAASPTAPSTSPAAIGGRPSSDALPRRPLALVTGASMGIGEEIARVLAERGHDVVLTARSEDRLHTLASELEVLGATTHVLPLDLASEGAVDRLVAWLGEQGLEIDVLVNNASSAPLGNFETISAETFETIVNTNIRSVFYLTQAVWRTMLQQGRGVIVNISSLAAIDPFPGFSLYGSSKAWLDILTHVLAAEGEAADIRVYSIRPGAVETPMLRGLFPDFPAEQCVQPEEVAQMIWRCINEPDELATGTPHHVTNQPDHS